MDKKFTPLEAWQEYGVTRSSVKDRPCKSCGSNDYIISLEDREDGGKDLTFTCISGCDYGFTLNNVYPVAASFGIEADSDEIEVCQMNMRYEYDPPQPLIGSKWYMPYMPGCGETQLQHIKGPMSDILRKWYDAVHEEYEQAYREIHGGIAPTTKGGKMNDVTEELEVVSLNMGDLKIEFMNRQGEPLKPGDTAHCYRFRVTGAGIDPKRVAAVEIPRLDYGNPDELLVKVTLRPSMPTGRGHLKNNL